MGEILMSEKEADRYAILCRVEAGALKLVHAGPLLGLSYRQTKRLWKKYREGGKQALISARRGRPSNNQIPKEVRNRAVSLIRERYPDFGPTFAAEKLHEEHGITLSKETVRQLKIQEGLHIPRQSNPIKLHQRRVPRACFGELSQIDGSPHAWFEERGPSCTLLLAIDDATGRIQSAHFTPTETTEGYFELLRQYICRHGIPRALYSDQYSVFRVNHGKNRDKPTQFARAAKELGVELICAKSPEAKGRIERKNGVLQDRLVKEMRLAGVSTIEQGNAFLTKYLEKHNAQFGKNPSVALDAHRPLNQEIDLDDIFCHKEARKVSKQLEVHYKNSILQIQAPDLAHSLRKQTVTVHEYLNGEVALVYKGRKLPFRYFHSAPAQPIVLDAKDLELYRPPRTAYIPHKTHPWRRPTYKLSRRAS